MESGLKSIPDLGESCGRPLKGADGLYYCPSVGCEPKPINGMKALQQHLGQKHQKRLVFGCAFCALQSDKLSYLKRHQLVHVVKNTQARCSRCNITWMKTTGALKTAHWNEGHNADENWCPVEGDQSMVMKPEFVRFTDGGVQRCIRKSLRGDFPHQSFASISAQLGGKTELEYYVWWLVDAPSTSKERPFIAYDPRRLDSETSSAVPGKGGVSPRHSSPSRTAPVTASHPGAQNWWEHPAEIYDGNTVNPQNLFIENPTYPLSEPSPKRTRHFSLTSPRRVPLSARQSFNYQMSHARF